ncbi:MAG: hypothetical protein AAFO94_22675, partial [Bacteroidota bacterium]
PRSIAYYEVRAYDQQGRALASTRAFYQANDETPPEAPIGLEARVSKAGVLTIEWDENTEEDLLGYRIFFSNSPDGNYSRLTSTYLPEAIYQDSMDLEVLNEFVYFKVVALDYRKNVSNFSKECKVQRPDVIPPAAPRISAVQSTTRGVELQWIESSSSDVVTHRLERKPRRFGEWRILEEWPPTVQLNQYIDSLADHLMQFEYRLVALDEMDLRGYSNVVTAKKIDNGIRPSVVLPEATADRRAKQVELQWQYLHDEDIHSFTIYRKSSADGLRELITVGYDALHNPDSKPNRKTGRF